MRAIPYRGGAVSTLLLVLLLTPPSEILDRRGAYADTQGVAFSSAAIPVELREGLRQDPGAVLPQTLGNWTGEDEDWPDRLSYYLAYDSLFVRNYALPGLYIPVQVMILSARHAQAFHDPEVCFTVQGGNVRPLESTTIAAPGAEGVQAPVGRMLITYDNASVSAPKLVYNLYIVERHDAAADRTTWIRLTFFGAEPTRLAEAEPFLLDLFDRLAPFLFQGTGEARTSAEWIARAAGWPVAIGGFGVALAPVAIEVLLMRRRAERPSTPP